MVRRIWAGALLALALPMWANAKPLLSRQAAMASGVRAVYDAASGKPTVYGFPVVLTFEKADAGKMLEIGADSPKPITIELWTGEIAKGATSWDTGRQFLGNSGEAPSKLPTFKWMIQPGTYTVLFVATLPPGQKPEPLYISYGREVRVPTAADKVEWEKASARYNVYRYRMAQNKRQVAPNFAAVDSNGKPFSLQQYRGKVVLVHFWSGAEEAVRHDIGYTKPVWTRYHNRNFEVLSFCLDTDATGWDAIQQEHAPWWPQVFDARTGNAAIAEKYGVDTTPTNFLLDGSGRIIARGVHFDRLLRAVGNAVMENEAYQAALKAMPDDDEEPAAEKK